MNDINILNASPTRGNTLNGLNYTLLSEFVYRVIGKQASLLLGRWYLPALSALSVLNICEHYIEEGSRKERSFESAQEAMHKDVEREFGILVFSWALLGKPCMVIEWSFAAKVIQDCIILHNMVVDARKDGYHSELFRLVERAVDVGFSLDIN